MKISIITVTNRPGGLDLQWYALKNQTFEDFEWIICDTLAQKRRKLLQKYTNNDKRIKHIQQDPKKEGYATGLAKAENQALREASGELCVMLQDYIWIPPQSLDKYWYAYKAMEKSLVSGVGNIYGKPGKKDIVDNNGLLTVFSKPLKKRPERIVWSDPRMRSDLGSFYECYPNDIEFNFCAVPMKCFKELGGLDEEYDKIGHAYDNVNVALRAEMLGYVPYLDQSNECRALDHDDFWPNKVKIDQKTYPIAPFHMQRMQDIREGKFPLKLDYLK